MLSILLVNMRISDRPIYIIEVENTDLLLIRAFNTYVT